MYRISIPSIVLWLLLANARHAAAQQLSANELNEVKSATVYLKVGQDGSDTPLQGSGFLVRPDLIVTNAHVLGLETQKLELPNSIECIFESGASNRELAILGEVAAVNLESDLAYVRIPPLEKPRKPLELLPESELRETLPIFIVGFPFGDLLARKDKNPSVTLGPGSISSLQRDRSSRVDSLQLDGTLIPGCSGGPIVTAEARVAAVSVSTILGTQIGFGIPSAKVARDLEGRPDQLTVRAVERDTGRYRLSLDLEAMDPLQVVTSAAVYLWQSSKQGAPNIGGGPSEASRDENKRTVRLQLDPTTHHWIGKVEEFELTEGNLVWIQPAVAVGKQVSLGMAQEYSDSLLILRDEELVVLPSNSTNADLNSDGLVDRSDASPEKDGLATRPLNDQTDLFTPIPLPRLVPLPQSAPFVPKGRPLLHAETRRTENGMMVPAIVSNPEPIRTLVDFDGPLLPTYSQIAVSPNGHWVFGIGNTPQGDVSIVDLNQSRVLSRVQLPSPARSIWCDDQRVAIVCQNEIVLLNTLTHAVVDTVHCFSEPRLKPQRIAGRAPDGSILTIWEYEGDKEFHYAFRLDDFGQLALVTKFAGYTGIYCQRGNHFLFLRHDLEKNSLGKPGLIEISRQRSAIVPSTISNFAQDVHWHSIRQSIDGHSLYVVLQPLNNRGNAFASKSYRIEDDLSKQLAEYPGQIVGEVLTSDSKDGYVVVVGLLSDRPGHVRAAYIDRISGKHLRWIDFPAEVSSISSGYSDSLSSAPVAFVPGREWLMWPNQNLLSIVPCGPTDLQEDVARNGKLVAPPPTKAKVGTTYSFLPKLKAADRNAQRTFRLKRSVVGMTIDPATAQVELDTFDFLVGDHLIEIEVLDHGTASSFLKWTLTIEN